MEEKGEFYEPAIRRGNTQYGDGYTENLFGRLNGIDTDFSMLVQRFAHGGLYDREVLPHKVRELCAIAALCVTGCFSQLRSHFQAAQSYGARDEKMLEVIFQMAVYGGLPCVFEGLRTFEDWKKSGRNMTGFGVPEEQNSD